MMQDEHTTFDDMGLPEVLLQGLKELGYDTPTPIQRAAIPVLLSGSDVIGQAQTGTGKTAAFALPLLARIDLAVRHPQVLILTPTRELASQVCEAIRGYGRFMKGLVVLPVYGGQGMTTQLRSLKRGVHVVVGTPGRVLDHLGRGTLRFDNLSAAVLDEADEMLSMGFEEEMEQILEATPAGRQMALFSATMPPRIQGLAKRYLSQPASVKMDSKMTAVDTVSQRYMYVSGAAKLTALDRYLEVEDFDAVIVFVRTRVATLELAEKLTLLGHSAAALNGDMSQPAREKTVNQFKRGRFHILVCTDVAARGLDVPRISHAVNYDIPTDTESYVHRIGRTGRAGRKGKALLFAGRREQRLLRNIERATRQKLERLEVPTARRIREKRIEAFKKTLGETLADVELDDFRTLVESFSQDAESDPKSVAAALMYLAQKERPFAVEDDVLEDRESRSSRDSQRPRSGGRPAKKRSGADDPRVYRVEVGRAHGLEPKHLVGAIANEAGLSSRLIGSIRIRDQYTTVELPQGMPNRILFHLQKVWVCGRQLRIKELGSAGEYTERGGRSRRGRDGRGAGGKPPFRKGGSHSKSHGRGAHKPRSSGGRGRKK